MRQEVSFLIAFLAAYLCTSFSRILAKALGVVDKPSKRKVHRESIPLLGGLAIYAGFFLAIMLNIHLLREHFALLIAASLIFLLGLIDDMRGLSAKFRFIVQFIAGLIVVIWGERISFFPPGVLGNLAEMVITLIWLVGVTNAFNYLDGLDGLACGSAVIKAFYFSAILYISGQFSLALLALLLAGACLGFLPHNFKKAKIFLGDAGSTFLGFLLAGIALAGNWAQADMVKIAIPILILGVPIFDMIFTTIMRIKEEKVKTFVEWLKYGGKDHFHHYLVHLGFSRAGAVAFIWSFTFYLGLSAVMLGNDRSWEGWLTLFQASIIFAIIGVLMVVSRKRRSGWNKEQ